MLYYNYNKKQVFILDYGCLKGSWLVVLVLVTGGNHGQLLLRPTKVESFWKLGVEFGEISVTEYGLAVINTEIPECYVNVISWPGKYKGKSYQISMLRWDCQLHLQTDLCFPHSRGKNIDLFIFEHWTLFFYSLFIEKLSVKKRVHNLRKFIISNYGCLEKDRQKLFHVWLNYRILPSSVPVAVPVKFNWTEIVLSSLSSHPPGNVTSS